MLTKAMAAEEEFPLHRLCSTGRSDTIFNYLEKNNSEVNQFDKKGFAPIHYTIGRESADIEQVLGLLFTHNADINARTLREGDTALHLVVNHFERRDAMMLSYKLLSLGADPDYRNDNHRTVYDIAMAKGDVELAELFTEELKAEDAGKILKEKRVEHYGDKLISMIMGDGTQADVEACLDQGADPNFINKHGAAAVHYTITHSPLHKLPVLMALRAAKADMNLTTYEGDTALNLVIKTEALRPDDVMYNLVTQFLEWGTNIKLKDLDGKDALTLAREKGYDDLVSLLLTHSGQGPISDRRQSRQIEMSFKAKSEQSSLYSKDNQH